jgi:hypothetical protein
MTRDLEQQYRRLLRWYPRQWRIANGEALLGTVLDAAEDEQRSTILGSEARGFASAGIRARADLIVMQPVRDAAATVALSMGAGGAVIAFLVSSWAPWGGQYALGGPRVQVGPFNDFGPVLAALWVAALVAALAGRWQLGRIAVLLAALVSIVMPYLADAIGLPSASWDRATLFYSMTAALLAAAGTPRTRLPLGLATTGFALITWTCFAYERPVGTIIWEPTLVLWDRLVWPWYLTALAIGIVLLLCLARLWTAAFTLLLATVPMIITFDLQAIRGFFHENGNPWILTAPIAVGLAALVLASHGALTLPAWHRHNRDTEPLT